MRPKVSAIGSAISRESAFMPSPFRIEGYAIVSSDGMIADAQAVFPQTLTFEADKQFYARELDRVDAVIQGRNSHEGQANSPRRRRLVLTRRVAGLAADVDAVNDKLWNP